MLDFSVLHILEVVSLPSSVVKYPNKGFLFPWKFA